jgi:hypothetical protein
MAAVFLIVSRGSKKALTSAVVAGSPVTQKTQGNKDLTQFWTLEATPPDSVEDFRIHPFDAPDLAITVKRDQGGDQTQPAPLALDANVMGEVWRISRIANPPYFFLLEGSNDLLMDVPGGSGNDGVTIQVFPRNENDNQQWTFLPAFTQLGPPMAMQPYQQTVEIQLPQGVFFGDATFSVPDNKLLIARYVSVSYDLPPPQLPFLRLTFSLGGQLSTIVIPIVSQLPIGQDVHFVGSQEIYMTAEGGTSISAYAGRSPAGGPAHTAVTVTISGYLIDP